MLYFESIKQRKLENLYFLFNVMFNKKSVKFKQLTLMKVDKTGRKVAI